MLLLASAERLGDPRLLRRAADAVGHLSWDDAVANVETSGLVTFTPTVEFRHPLVRSAVYYSATASDRRRAHTALAEALDAETDADRRAWHLGAAATGPDEQVARALEASAERARQRGGSSAAAVYLRRAAELTPDPGRASSGSSRRRGPSSSPVTGRRPAKSSIAPGRADSAPNMTPTPHGPRR